MTPNTATPVSATNNWWGLRTGTVTLPTPGPAVWPDVVTPSATTYNPPVPENPVNGSAVANASCPAGVSDSNAVTFCPYRSSDQADTVGGEWPIPDAPAAIEDPPNCTSNGVQFDPNIPTYDAFFGTTLGSGTTGNGLSGATPSAKKTAQLTAYMQAIVNAINSNPATTGTRVGIKMYQSGSSVLGVPFYVAVVGTPDNIANLDAGRNDAAFWRGVHRRDDVAGRRARRRSATRPGFGWITATPHGNEPAGGEASAKELYELAARTDCDNQRRLHNLDVFIQPVTAPGRPRPQRPHDGVELRPEPRLRHRPDAREQGAPRRRPRSTRACSSSTPTSRRRATSSRRTRTRRSTRSRTSRST